MTDDLSVSPQQATRTVLLGSIPAAIAMVALYSLLTHPSSSAPSRTPPLDWLFFLLATVIGVFIHEGIHTLGWACFGAIPFGRIRFGFVRQTLSPYAHALDPMPAGVYRVGVFLPALVLGAIPYVIGILVTSAPIALFGAIFTLAAGGDFLVLWLIRRLDRRAMVLAPPSRVGCIVISQPNP